MFAEARRETPGRLYNAAVLSFRLENGKLKASSSPMPKIRPGWALVRVRLAGICNTDVGLLHGYYNFRGVPGHEFVGGVEELQGISTEEKKKWLGRPVCGETSVSSRRRGRRRRCDYCG